MYHCITCVGLDVHQKSVEVAMLLPDAAEVVRSRVANRSDELRALARRLKSSSEGGLVCCYEAGPCGYQVQRVLTGAGIDCRVVAPSFVLRSPGERVKTDRRDALKLAQQLQAGLLREVTPPTEEQEAVRDLVRLRDAYRQERQRARQRLLAFLQRRGLVWPRHNWTKAHWAWLGKLAIADELAAQVFEQLRADVRAADARLEQADARLAELAESEPYRAVVEALRCLRGIGMLTAMMLCAELYQPERFGSARQFMAFLGLVPSEHSSGEKRRRGGLTRAGNSRARRVLVEAAWHQMRPVRVTAERQRLREEAPGWAGEVGQCAERRLHDRYWHLVGRQKRPCVALAAVARELAGFVWDVMVRCWAEEQLPA